MRYRKQDQAVSARHISQSRVPAFSSLCNHSAAINFLNLSFPGNFQTKQDGLLFTTQVFEGGCCCDQEEVFRGGCLTKSVLRGRGVAHHSGVESQMAYRLAWPFVPK